MGRFWHSSSKRSSDAFFALALAAVCALLVTVFVVSRSPEDESPRAARRGAELFRTEFTPEQGLGPLFNERACSGCHAEPAVGGVGPDGLATVLRVGRLTDAGFDPRFGNRRIEARAHSISELGVACDRSAGIPAGANVTSVRNTPSLFGAGLIDAIPDEVIRAGAVDKGDGVRGRPNLVVGPDGGEDVGRFGWKADGPTLELFVAEAFRSELGVTSPLAPGDQIPAGTTLCPGESSDPDTDPDTVAAVTAFVAELPAPAPRGSHPAGEAVFEQAGCASCHVPALQADTGPVPLYSDLLIHDMGPALDDAVVQESAGGAEWRTAPLWGLSDRTRFLHDGRADSFEAAILAHGGEAQSARERFRGLSDDELQSLLEFLRTL
jgi:CxxC motif-containing protein (DUF1111 family)